MNGIIFSQFLSTLSNLLLFSTIFQLYLYQFFSLSLLALSYFLRLVCFTVVDNMGDRQLVVDMRQLDSLEGSQLDDMLGLDNFQAAPHMAVGQVLDIVVEDTFVGQLVEELNDCQKNSIKIITSQGLCFILKTD